MSSGTRNATKRSDSPSGASKPQSDAPKVSLLDINSAILSLTTKINDISENQKSLNVKIDSSVDQLTATQLSLGRKIDDVTDRVHGIIDERFECLRSDLLGEFSRRIDHNEQEVIDLKARNAELQETCASLSNRIEELSQQATEAASVRADLADKLEFNEKETDIIVRGIPMVERRENCKILYERIAVAIGYPTEMIPKADAFRLGRKKAGARNDPPILLRFSNRFEKSDFFKKYLGKLTLNLSDIGFDLNTRIYMAENLTVAKQKILQEALKMKREGALSSVKSKFGAIRIQRNKDANEVQIHRLSDL
jgi:prefoldin subunit 5